MNIIELTKEAGIEIVQDRYLAVSRCTLKDAEDFAALVLKNEADETRARFAQAEQPEREWVDLTSDEIAEVWRKSDSVKASKELFNFLLPKNLVIARAVIAAFKEKNK